MTARRPDAESAPPVRGYVTGFGGIPGRNDLWVTLTDDYGAQTEQTYAVKAGDPGARVKFDGVQVDAGELAKRLAHAGSRVWAELKLLPEMSGMAREAAFTTSGASL